MQLLQLLEFCVSWLVGVTGWTPQYWPWLYTLLVRLEKPLTPDTARCCGTSPPPGRGGGEPPAAAAASGRDYEHGGAGEVLEVHHRYGEQPPESDKWILYI